MKFLASALALAVVVSAFGPEADAGKRRRASKTPSDLRGGPAAQKRHNRAADADGLSRLDDRADLERFISAGLLVEVADTDAYYLDALGGHDASHADLYAHARPWTKRFLDRELGDAHAKFGHRFKVTSLVRTARYQKKICAAGNRAAVCGTDWWEQSLHLTGATVDVSKEGMSSKTLAWMRKRLVRLQDQGLVAAIEEAGAFHVFVRKAYGKVAVKPKKKPAKKKARKRKKRRKTRK